MTTPVVAIVDGRRRVVESPTVVAVSLLSKL